MNLDRISDGVRQLLATAKGALPVFGLGIVRRDCDDQVFVCYADAIGLTGHRVRASKLPPSLCPGASPVAWHSAGELAVPSDGFVASRLLYGGLIAISRPEHPVSAIVTLPVPGHAASLIVALHDDSRSTAVDHQLQELADRAARCLDPVESFDGELDLLRALNRVEMLLPSLFDVTQTEEIFARIADPLKVALRLDFASVGVMTEDLSQIYEYVQTSPTLLAQPTGPMPFPPQQSEGFLYRFVDDLSASLLDRDREMAKAGGLSSMRVAIRLDDRLMGVLNVTVRSGSPYTPIELVLGERIAGHIGLAVAHHRLVEESRRTATLRERVATLQMQAGLLSTLSGVLDIRNVFHRVSEVAQTVLKHDALTLGEILDGGKVVRIHAAYGLGELRLPLDLASSGRRPLDEPHKYRVFDDIAARPEFANSPGLAAGMRSMLVVPLSTDLQHFDGLTFYAKNVGQFTNDDALLAMRIGDHVALAISHERLAEESRRAAALAERTANLEMLDGLLKTLTGVLDIRAVFDRVSAIADNVLPHDALSITEVLGDGDMIRTHASHGLGALPEPYDIPIPDRTMLTEPWDYRLIDDVRLHPEYSSGPGMLAGMRSMMFLAIRLEGRLFGGLNFYSRTVGRYGPDDVLVARRITDHVALALSHQRLAEEARRNEELRAQRTNLELLDEFLGALVDSGDLPEVFDRLSEIAKKVLVHDAVVLMVRLPDGTRAQVFASSGLPLTLPSVTDVPEELLQDPDWEYHIYDDFDTLPPRYAALSQVGLQSLLRVPIRLDGKFAGALVFFSRSRAAFKQSDVLIARRMADRLALKLTRDREVEASRRADEASARASKLESRVRALTEELDARTGFRRVVGESRPWRQVLTQATQVASTDTTVLLLGESGTGKEVVARFLHRASGRANGPFIALNCAALPEQLLEAELFGYERGAYTGATQSKPGQLEQAAGGTLFLDEVGEMSPTAQAKFLRVLQEKEFQRLGGTRVLRTDARIVAATNRDLARAISQGQFREDLYYRLNVFAINLPPLRDRRDDILPLSEAFLNEIGRGIGRPPAGISRDARKLLTDYQWPGNVRELRNILERAAILCEGGLITAEHLALTVMLPAAPARSIAAVPAAATATAPARPVSAGDLQSLEREMIEEALKTARFNKSKAAKSLGLTRQQLYVRMRKYGLE